ncbi:Peptidoglycan-N-acetylmuramic acid deacetylase PdaC [Sporomusa ovata DSM 2662]|nr:polysaccharide deacetylase family protein [Sporomusa ovata]EQB27757.1 polysaccharide deacetylase [Sporomusa ovata DSM 2662]
MHSLLRRNFFCFTVFGISLVCSLVYEATMVFDDKIQVIKSVPTTHKVVALTIDDGPHYKTTPELLAVLREKQVKATFFLLGANVEAHPEIVMQTVADGHEIASHAYSHKRLNKLTKTEVIEEFERFETITQPLAPKPSFFRPPDGAYNDDIVALARERGYTTVLWSIDAGDWRRPPVQQVVQAVVDNVKPGGIILMHDGQYPLPTAQAAAIIIDKLQSQGYQLVTMSELMQYYEESQ